ncbi:hypothetical protein GCM10010112_73570 [Actinoplanes lobatus]|uniref:SWIM-type domain-containing protein n=1 Tax=Actinoplanes lobatus TaxID=113568 RepID=A0A7W7MD68_9ACTN|nr:hypothetical protein [Actinoplanes lobatus]MBB4745894.1 hypothetical protein [Actinoplanes lobatus]GGN89245.1 hypothetical protein GCM10010112_73570 [Actinoplanes lobatus]GIE43617.1 hypothetical protein Alo02nite_65150 [Actinoplanes lobatus]
MSELASGSVSLPVRADLRALDADALAALANRGLVKRAAREAEREPPALSAGEGATVVAEFADGVRAELPEGGLEQGRCTCGAAGACRHLLGLIFAYQAALPQTAPSEDEPPAEAAAWSPGGFTDEDLATRIGSRLVETARRTHRNGYTARIRRGAVPVAELPAATVRFLVPGDLGYVHTDARAGVRDDVIALAVWAFRAADEQYPDAGECSVDVGGAPGAAVTGSGLEPVTEFAAEVLRAGAVHAGPGLVAAAAGHQVTLDRAGLRWPLGATAELAEQLTAYRDRSARYAPERLADLIAELFARHRAVSADSGAGHRARVLGSEEAAETPLRRVRLDGLGARVTAVDGQRRVEIFHGQAASGVVLVSHRQWETDEDGPALGRRRIAGATVDAIASGALVTESAIRSASRTVRLGAGRIAKSTVTVSNGAWEGLPPGLLAYDYAKLAAELDAMPPRPVRARVRAELVRVLAIAEVGESWYAPGAQRLRVEIRDASGVTATVEATHAAVAPGRLDAVAAALDGRRGRPRFVAGSVHRCGGRVVIDPYAIAADGPPVVPDLAVPPTGQGLGSADGPAGSADPGDPLAEAVAAARDVLAEAAHSGLAHLPGAHTDRLRSARAALARVGLHRVASSLDEVVARLGPDPGAEATWAWVDAYLRVSLAADLR